VPKLSIIFGEILLSDHVSFEHQNRLLEFFINIINYYLRPYISSLYIIAGERENKILEVCLGKEEKSEGPRIVGLRSEYEAVFSPNYVILQSCIMNPVGIASLYKTAT
jgi:hypothetical protein